MQKFGLRFSRNYIIKKRLRKRRRIRERVKYTSIVKLVLNFKFCPSFCKK